MEDLQLQVQLFFRKIPFPIINPCSEDLPAYFPEVLQILEIIKMRVFLLVEHLVRLWVFQILELVTQVLILATRIHSWEEIKTSIQIME
jgi:hypothetical protein